VIKNVKLNLKIINKQYQKYKIMKTLTSIKLISLVVLFFAANFNSFSQVSFPSEVEKNLTAQHLEQVKIVNEMISNANLKLDEANKIENEYKKLEDKDNTNKYENKIWEAKAYRIEAQELLLESDIIISNIYLEVIEKADFVNAKTKENAIHNITMAQLKLEVATESLSWFKERVKNKLADVMNTTIVSFMETIQGVQKEASNFQSQALAFYLTENNSIQYSNID